MITIEVTLTNSLFEWKLTNFVYDQIETKEIGDKTVTM